MKKYQPRYIEEAAKKYDDSKIGTTLVLPGTSGRFDDGCFKSKWIVLTTTHAGQPVQILQHPDTGTFILLQVSWFEQTLNFGYLEYFQIEMELGRFHIVIQYGPEMTWTFVDSTSQVQESTAREDSTPAYKHTLDFLMGDLSGRWLRVICGQLYGDRVSDIRKKMIYCK